jgi:hypothetical protein
VDDTIVVAVVVVVAIEPEDMMMFIYIERVCVCFLTCKRAREVVGSRCDLPLRRRRRKELEIYILREVNYIQTGNKRERAECKETRSERETHTSRLLLVLCFFCFLKSARGHSDKSFP